MNKYTLNQLTLMKKKSERIVAATVYDATQAKILSKNGVECPVIGTGPCCDGQIIILHDLLGFDAEDSILFQYEHHTGVNLKKHFRNFVDTSKNGIAGAARDYVNEVKSLDFPNENETY